MLSGVNFINASRLRLLLESGMKEINDFPSFSALTLAYLIKPDRLSDDFSSLLEQFMPLLICHRETNKVSKTGMLGWDFNEASPQRQTSISNSGKLDT